MFRTCKRQNSLPKVWPIKESSPVILKAIKQTQIIVEIRFFQNVSNLQATEFPAQSVANKRKFPGDTGIYLCQTHTIQYNWFLSLENMTLGNSSLFQSKILDD